MAKGYFRILLCAVVSVLLVVSAAVCGAAPSSDGKLMSLNGFPNKPIEVVTHSGVGGGGDLISRAMIAAGQQFVPQPMVVVNKQGAASNGMAAYLESGKTDGYTINVATPTNLLWYLMGQNNMDIHEFLIPIARMMLEPQVIIVPASSKYKTIQEFMEDYKAGKTHIAGDPVGGSGWMFAAVMSNILGVEINYIPFADGAEANTALLGNNVDLSYTQFSEAVEQEKGGMVRMLAVASEERLPGEYSNVPTLKECGIDYVFPQWRGYFCRAGTPPELVQYWADVLKKAHDDSAFQKWLSDNDAYPGYLGPDEFKQFVIEQEAMVVELLKAYAPDMLREGY